MAIELKALSRFRIVDEKGNISSPVPIQVTDENVIVDGDVSLKDLSLVNASNADITAAVQATILK